MKYFISHHMMKPAFYWALNSESFHVREWALTGAYNSSEQINANHFRAHAKCNHVCYSVVARLNSLRGFLQELL